MGDFEPALEGVPTGLGGCREAQEWLMAEAWVEGVLLSESGRPGREEVGRWGQGVRTV